MYCSNCGGENPDITNFCSKCGQKLHLPETSHPQGFRQPIQSTGAGPLASARTDGKAVASLVLGFLSVTILWVLAGIPAIILGHLARGSIKRSMGQLKGEGIALAGLIMGYISVAAVPFLLIIATIAIPSLLRSRQAAQETSAVAQLRTINTAEVTYLSSNAGSYGGIAALVSQGLLDSRFLGSISGYTFTVTAAGSDYVVTATPTSPNAGRYGYMSLPDAVVRYQEATSSNCVPCFPPGQAGAPTQ